MKVHLVVALLTLACVGLAEAHVLRGSKSERSLASDNFCGSSWTAATQCSRACPNGLDSECLGGEACYGGVTCVAPAPAPTTNYCGTSWTDAAATCGQTCPNGVDSECPSGTSCFGDITSCEAAGAAPAPTTNYCGTSWTDAAATCGQTCPNGVDSECPSGTSCFGDITSCDSRPTDPPSPSPVPQPAPTDAPSSSAIPTPAPTITSSPTAPSAPSTSPSQAPSAFEPGFKGIKTAFSLKKGVIDVTWEPPFFTGPHAPDDTVYDIFVAYGQYDFNGTLQNTTVFDLISLFENEPTFQHYRITDGELKIAVTVPNFGELHTLLVTCEVGGVYSPNTVSSAVVVSASDPHVRDDANVVGIFVPTQHVDIAVDEAPQDVQHTVTFSGAVSVEAQNLDPEDIITGFNSDLVPFIRRVLRIVHTSPDLVVLDVVHVRLEEVFDELEMDGTFGMSKTELDPESGRRLGFFDSLVGFVTDTVEFIGDAVGTVVDSIVDFVEQVANPEMLMQYTLVEVNQQWEEEIVPDYITLRGEMNFEAQLIVQIRITALFATYARIGFEADYSFETSLDLSAEVSKEASKDIEIWSSGKRRTVFFVGPVLVEAYWEPKLELKMEAKASLSVGTQIGIRVEGGTRVYAVVDVGQNPALYNTFEPPSFEPSYTLPTLEGEASLEASIALVLSLDAGLYGGLLNANAGLSAGLGMEVSAGVQTLGLLFEDVVPTMNKFDLNILFSIPFSAEALYGLFTIIDTNIFEKRWPILTLPSVELEINDNLRCILGGGSTGSAASLGIAALESYPSDALIGNSFVESGTWYLHDESDGWNIRDTESREVRLEKTGLGSFSTPPTGSVTFAVQPKFPPLPFKVLTTVSLESLLLDVGTGVQCTELGSCDGDLFFDALADQLSAEFNSQIFLSQPPDPSSAPVPSTVYKFEDFMTALKKLQRAGDNFKLWLGDDCSIDSTKAALVNMAAFLGQAMRETIIYDACDENNWDMWRADIFKEPTSPAETLPALYPMSSGCGQLGQKYAEYTCEDECPQDLNMEFTATTNAAWIGAPPPLFCGPRSKYDGLGYWNSQQFCAGPDNSCTDEPFYYPGQTAGVHVPVSEDDRFPDFFYTNPLPDASGFVPQPRSSAAFPATNVEGCCWWGRGVIQTTGRCNFGKLNKRLGAGAGSDALYPDINFCSNPQAVCDGPSDLKWVAGIFFWVADPQVYDSDGFNYKDGVREFVEMGCADDPDGDGCDFLFEYASGIVNRGCHDPGEAGCLGCVPGATCDPAHHIPERVEASKKALRALMKAL